MSNILRIFLSLILGLFSIMDGFAVPKPPSPTAKTAATSGFDPPPGDLSIASDIAFLVAVAVLLGMYMIYRDHFKNKKIANLR